MSGFLARVIADKKHDIEALRPRRGELMHREGPQVGVRDFSEAVRGGGIIAELKRRSPSVASFPRGDDPLAQVELYAANGAAAVSIVTDTPRFGMTLRDVGRVRSRVPLPVLVKDFVIDPLQIHAAWSAGADAILLIARLVPVAQLAALAECSAECGLTALVECHDEDDLAKADRIGAGVVGVNSRNLDTFAMDSGTANRLLAAGPPGALMIAESGLRTPADVQTAREHGADAFLIGSALLEAPDPGLLLRHLRGDS